MPYYFDVICALTAELTSSIKRFYRIPTPLPPSNFNNAIGRRVTQSSSSLMVQEYFPQIPAQLDKNMHLYYNVMIT